MHLSWCSQLYSLALCCSGLLRHLERHSQSSGCESTGESRAAARASQRPGGEIVAGGATRCGRGGTAGRRLRFGYGGGRGSAQKPHQWPPQRGAAAAARAGCGQRDRVPRHPGRAARDGNGHPCRPGRGRRGCGMAVQTLARHRQRRGRGRGRYAERPIKLLGEFVPLVVFALASAGFFLMFDWPPLLRLFVLTFLSAVIAFRTVRTVSGVLLRPPGSPSRIRRSACWSSTTARQRSGSPGCSCSPGSSCSAGRWSA